MKSQPRFVDQQTGQTGPICIDCGDPFERTEEEIAQRRGTGMPLSARCPVCRTVHLEARNAKVLESLRTGDLRHAQPASPGPVDAAARLYPADCSGCRRPIRLPFKPRLDRPVFCRFCLESRSGR